MARVAILDVDCATFASNAADFQRYARRPFDVIPRSIIDFPIANFKVGNLVCASSQVIFDELIWNSVTLLDMTQVEQYATANRGGCFFIALMFAYCAIFSSVFENSLPAGNDLSAPISVTRFCYFTYRTGLFVSGAASG